MSGILDSKSRVIDAMLTSEGRRQLSEDRFSIKYVTFTDADVAYIPDVEEGHVDPAGKIYLEACNLPQDRIVFESDESGGLKAINPASISVKSGVGSLNQSQTVASFESGRLVARNTQYGPRLRATAARAIEFADGDGFSYADPTGSVTASIFFTPSAVYPGKNDEIKYVPPPTVNDPYFAVISVKNNPSADHLASLISQAINIISSSNGPQVSTTTSDDYVFFAYDGLSKINLKYLGQLTSDQINLEDTISGGRNIQEVVSGPSFTSQVLGILTSSFDNFVELQTLSSIDYLKNDENFSLSKNYANFGVGTIPFPLKDVVQATHDVNVLDSLFSDDKLSNVDTFAYLPPIVKVNDNTFNRRVSAAAGQRYDKTAIGKITTLSNDNDSLKTVLDSYLLGDYPALGRNYPMQFAGKDGLQEKLRQFGETNKSSFYFSQTSSNNRLLMQAFEVRSLNGSNDVVNKLDIVDYGTIEAPATSAGALGTQLRVLFVGKTFLDKTGNVTFVNMFTLVFSKEDVNL
jgi:hypothetical protein